MIGEVFSIFRGKGGVLKVLDLGYTKANFLGTLAQTTLLEGKYEDAEWLYLRALELSQSHYEKHIILNDLVMFSQKLRDFERMEKYARMDLKLFKVFRIPSMKR